MSLLQYPNSIDTITHVQVWNNAAFDDGDADAVVIKSSFSSLQSMETDSNLSKENYNPSFCRSPVCSNSPKTLNPLRQQNSHGNSLGKPLKVLFKEGLLSPIRNVEAEAANEANEAIRDVSKIDAEMEEIQNEITRLSMKLESLRVEKEERVLKPAATPKFVGKNQSCKVSLIPKVGDGVKLNRKEMGTGPSEVSGGGRFQRGKPEITPIQLGKSRRGISLGPSELMPIQSVKNKRGVTLGPAEIIAGVKSQRRGKLELVHPQSTQQSRRKSCFYKLQGVDEVKVTKECRGRSLSLSPKTRQAQSKIQASERRFTTIGSNKTVRKNDQVLSSIQPKNLFREGEQLAPGKRLVKGGRVVPSRYNQISSQGNGSQAQNDARKISFPGNEECEKKKCERKRSSSVGRKRVFLPEIGSNQNTENKVEIYSNAMRLTKDNPTSITNDADFLPKIRTIRSIYDSPRDSGPAKRVAELIGRKSYFGEEERTVCQALSFDDEEEE